MLQTIITSLILIEATEPPKPVESATHLARIQRAPAFALTNQAGKPVRLSDLRGRVLLVSFIFTTCNGSCPATTHRMCQVQEELKKRGLDRDGRVRLISITLDPARDSREALHAYARLYDANLTNWDFLTGPPGEVAKVIADWGMWVRPAANGQLDHPSRIFLVDRGGTIREIYSLDYLKARWVADDIGLLVNESTARRLDH